MATIALPRTIAPHQSPASIGSLASTLTLDSINAQQDQRTCHTGLAPQTRSEPTALPCPRDSAESADEYSRRSLLYPPDDHSHLESGPLLLYNIEASGVASALDYLSRQPLPDPSLVFPWFHGLHPSNQVQQAFFIARHRALKRTPRCLRGVTLVKADGDLSVSRLKGAIAPSEFLDDGLPSTGFLDIDPKDGFSVRNFQIQAAKAAMTSDIIVYGHDNALVQKLGWDIVAAQQKWREKHESQGHPLPGYNTFICLAPFSEFEQRFPEIVAVDSTGRPTGNVLDLFLLERKEMYNMTMASEISHNVWLGPTPDSSVRDGQHYDILIECSDLGRLDPAALQALAESPDDDKKLVYFELPSSGSILAPASSHADADADADADGILETCKWIFHLARGSSPPPPTLDGIDHEGDSPMNYASQVTPRRRPRKILIHCADGYTESSMLAIAYFSYSTGRPIPDAWLDLHTLKQRNFFAYATDVALLSAIAPRLLRESPVCSGKSPGEITALVNAKPRWFAGLDGSLPSRILDYMYLGNLTHANNPTLLKELGISQILSVGEVAIWQDDELEEWGSDNICVIQGVQDNGIDPLMEEFERCLAFIDQGRKNGTATLVHCRVGVSRSATICIAEVMRSMEMSFPRAYCFVRARRLNVIIQPHLRFAYELLKWEEYLRLKSATDKSNAGPSIKRELEWAEIAREVALMNRPYAR